MTQKLLLVDFENVQQVELARLDDSFQSIIFVGAAQKSMPIELVTHAQKRGSRLEWQRVDANGRNARDFVIACQLGRVLERSPPRQCIVLSKDKGVDPLLRHLNKTGLQCHRLHSLLALDPKAAAPPEEPHDTRVIEVLGKSETKSRPRKRNTLSQHLSSIFQKKLPQAEVDRLIDILLANKMISEPHDTITYEF
jgi:PIN domain